MSDNNPLKWRGVSRSSLQGRLHHALGHAGTQAFFEHLLKPYGDAGKSLAERIAQDNPAGIRATAIAKVEAQAAYANWGHFRQTEGHCAAQVWALGAGVVYATDWARVWPDSLRLMRKSLGWITPAEAA